MSSVVVAPTGDNVVVKTGVVKKRSGKMHQWSTRFFVLSEAKISYKIKQEASQFKCSYELSAGCIVTEVQVESTIKGKKLYSFWIVWPHEKKSGKDDEHHKGGEDSDDDNGVIKSSEDDSKSKTKDLKQIVESEVMTQKRQRSLVEEQIELHHARDNNVSLGAKVAAVAVGGVVVGALTAGIGLIPYITVVGITAVAGGGAVAWQWRRPLDSRLIMACDSMEEAMEWKTAIEQQINKIEDTLRPVLPSTVDPKIISSIIDRSTIGGTWRRVDVCEGMSILEHVLPKAYYKDSKISQKFSFLSLDTFNPSTCMDQNAPYSSLAHEFVNDAIQDACLAPIISSCCRRAQQSIGCTSINTFLAAMNAQSWPKSGTFKVAREIDDHADVIEVEVTTNCTPYGGKCNAVTRKLYFSRFWTLDDDGVYLITYNSASGAEFKPEVKKGKDAKFTFSSADKCPTIDAVITISPRIDSADFEYDVAESMVTCNCQVSTMGDWEGGEMVAFMDNFLKDNLLELKHTLINLKYSSFLEHGVFHDGSSNVATATSLSAAELVDTKNSHRESDSMPPTPPPNRNAKGRRGVTTVQPGMEDMTPVEYADRNLSNDGVPPTPSDSQRSPTIMKSKGMLGMFRRKGDKEKDAADNAAPTGRARSPQRAEPTKAEFSTPVKLPESPVDRNRKRATTEKKRDKSTNSEATILRSQIAATEYELSRLSKTMRKKIIINNPAISTNPQSTGQKIEKHHITSSEYSALQDQQSELQRKLQSLRQRHVQLTGETYEQAKASRSGLMRWRTKAKVGNPLSAHSEDGISMKGAGGVQASHKSSPRPRHWVSFNKKEKPSSLISLVSNFLALVFSRSYWTQVCSQSFLDDESDISNEHIRNRLFFESDVVIVLVFLCCLVLMGQLPALIPASGL